MTQIVFQVSEALAVINQTLDYAYPALSVQGEVSGFKINQGKWVFFDLKDESGTIACFMSLPELNIELCDGMQIIVRAKPAITKWGKFSLTVQQLQPIGEGSIKKAFDLLKKKLTDEGLFDLAKKRSLPYLPSAIGVISSTGAAGYKDFIKVISSRFPELSVATYHAQVQGLDAPAQIIQGVEYFNNLSNPPEVLAIIRGGGSADDLAAFNDEALVRKIASSRLPTITGIGHEIDTTLADLAADFRASTPSNVAELLVPDRRELITETNHRLASTALFIENQIANFVENIEQNIKDAQTIIMHNLENIEQKLALDSNLLTQLNPENILRKGYCIMRNQARQIITKPKVGDNIYIENHNLIMEVNVKNVQNK